MLSQSGSDQVDEAIVEIGREKRVRQHGCELMVDLPIDGVPGDGRIALLKVVSGHIEEQCGVGAGCQPFQPGQVNRELTTTARDTCIRSRISRECSRFRRV